jgi:hypothetical protein
LTPGVRSLLFSIKKIILKSSYHQGFNKNQRKEQDFITELHLDKYPVDKSPNLDVPVLLLVTIFAANIPTFVYILKDISKGARGASKAPKHGLDVPLITPVQILIEQHRDLSQLLLPTLNVLHELGHHDRVDPAHFFNQSPPVEVISLTFEPFLPLSLLLLHDFVPLVDDV